MVEVLVTERETDVPLSVLHELMGDGDDVVIFRLPFVSMSYHALWTPELEAKLRDLLGPETVVLN